MDEAPPRPRRVFVLGREATFDVDPVAKRVVAEGAELVLLSLGYPVTPGQEAVVGDALRLANELRLWLDTVLVTSPEEAAEYVRADDEVTLLASGRERKRLERVLGKKVRLTGEVRIPPPRPHPHWAQSHPPRRSRSGGRPESEEATTPLAREGSDAHVDVDREAAPSAIASTESESVEALAGREVVQPVLETVWTREDAQAKKRAPLRVYLGAAPGVGKTYAMLSEGQRRRSRGTDVVVGIVQTYGRPKTKEMLEGLEIVSQREIEYRGSVFEEMDTEAIIERSPEVALVDELAHTNIPTSRRAKRWEDVIDILGEGITVITTLNVQHLASVNDVVAEVTGIKQQETVPDWVLDLADDIELVDMSPTALQRRMMHGNVYPDPRKAELALRRFFTTENLTALRELALMRVANQVDEALLAQWSRERSPETRERVLVCVSRPDMSEELIRRGGRIAQRTGGELIVIHVVSGDRGPDPEWLEQVERLASDLGGKFLLIEADDPVEGVLSFAYQQHVTQILVGESLRSRWQELMTGSFVNRLIRQASNVDIHVLARRER
jgi:nucleotide-binding universal stress UspA family protein